LAEAEVVQDLLAPEELEELARLEVIFHVLVVEVASPDIRQSVLVVIVVVRGLAGLETATLNQQ
jgi:hypothetical protein